MNTEREVFDAAYVKRLTEGDPATEQHFTVFFGELLRIKLRARLRSRDAADDVRQETFLRVLTTLRQKQGIDHPERLGAFVNSVCNNVMLETFRSQSRTAALPEDGFEPPDEDADFEDEFVNEQQKRHIRRLLKDLPHKDRELLSLVFYEERDKDEVCRRLGVDRDYLRVLLHRATGRLRESYRKSLAALHSFFFCL